MTVSDNAVSFRYEGNGSTDTFAFSGRIFTTGDLVVEIITRATDVLVETLTITTDYTVTINSDESASVQVTNASKVPSSTQDIQIRRSLAQSQTVDLPTGTVFPAKSVENALDKNVAIIQELSSDVARSVKLAQTSSLSNIELPAPVGSEVIGWNAGATGLTTYAQADFIGPTGPQGPAGDIDDITAQPTATPAAGDFAVFADISDSNNTKKATIEDFITPALLDEDDMSSDSNTQAPTQQSVKAYVDGQDSGGWVPLQTQTVSTSVSSVEFTSGIDSTYKAYAIRIDDGGMTEDGRTLNVRYSTDGGSSYISTNYNFKPQGSAASTGQGAIVTSPSIGNASGETFSGFLYFENPAGTSNHTTCTFEISGRLTSGTIDYMSGSGDNDSTSAVNAIELKPSGGSFDAGTLTLYGLASA